MKSETYEISIQSYVHENIFPFRMRKSMDEDIKSFVTKAVSKILSMPSFQSSNSKMITLELKHVKTQSIRIFNVKKKKDEFIIQERPLKKTKWIFPSNEALEKEYTIEYLYKPIVQSLTKNAFPTKESFIDHVLNKSRVITLSKEENAEIANRSRTKSKLQLLELIKGYRSYPTYRNEKTIDDLYKRIKENKSVDMPIIFQFKDGSKRVFSGNTRLDIAFQLNKEVEVIIVEIDNA